MSCSRLAMGQQHRQPGQIADKVNAALPASHSTLRDHLDRATADTIGGV